MIDLDVYVFVIVCFRVWEHPLIGARIFAWPLRRLAFLPSAAFSPLVWRCDAWPFSPSILCSLCCLGGLLLMAPDFFPRWRQLV